MAFSTSNVQRTYFGNLQVMYGDWSGSVGDAAGSVTLGGGRVYLVEFSAILPNGTSYIPQVQYNTSQSGAVLTLTVNNTATVSNGQFIVIYR